MSIETLARFGQTMVPGIVKYIKTNWEKTINGEWKEVLGEDTMNTAYVETKQLEDMATIQETSEMSPGNLLGLEEGYSKRIGHRVFAAKIAFTKDTVKLGGKDRIKRLREGLQRSPRQALDTIAMNYLEYGDTAVASVPKHNNIPIIDPIGGDGLVMFHTAHTFNSDALNTYSNKTASLQTVSHSSLISNVQAVKGWRNNVGNSLEADINHFLIPINLEDDFFEIFRSPGRSDTANRTESYLNSLFGSGGYKVLRKMISTTEWFARTNLENDLKFFWAWKPELDDEYDKDKRTHYVYLDFAVGHGFNDPRAFYANKI